MSDWKVGDRVQVEKDNKFRVGVVSAVDSQQVERVRHDWYSRKEVKYIETEIKSVDVKWDDGEEQKGLSRWDLDVEDSEMERAFRLSVNDAQARIEAEMDKAWDAIQAAVKISEETGVPFRASVSPLSQSYMPRSLGTKFPDVDQSFASEIAGASGEYDGWQHSAVC